MSYKDLPEELLRAVTPQDARAYALANGWERVEGVDGHIALFRDPKSDLDQLIVPLNVNSSDYDRRVAELVANIAEKEHRAALEVLNDLMMPSADVLRFRIVSPDSEKGMLPLEEGIDLLEGARKALLSAACSVVTPQRHHPRMSRTEATQLVKSCRLGQTERGSFTVSIACPLRMEQGSALLLDSTFYFARQVTSMLMRSVDRLVTAIEADRTETVYDETPGAPVLSANLCEALLGMQPSRERSFLNLSVTWARTLPQPSAADIARTVEVKYEHFPIIEDVYSKLRPSEEPETSLFVGMVDTLNGDPGDDGRVQGEVTILFWHEDEIKKARVDLHADDYVTADRAHMSAGFVSFRGILHPGRRTHRITDIKDFRLYGDAVT